MLPRLVRREEELNCFLIVVFPISRAQHSLPFSGICQGLFVPHRIPAHYDEPVAFDVQVPGRNAQLADDHSQCPVERLDLPCAGHEWSPRRECHLVVWEPNRADRRAARRRRSSAGGDEKDRDCVFKHGISVANNCIIGRSHSPDRLLLRILGFDPCLAAQSIHPRGCHGEAGNRYGQ